MLNKRVLVFTCYIFLTKHALSEPFSESNSYQSISQTFNQFKVVPLKSVFSPKLWSSFKVTRQDLPEKSVPPLDQENSSGVVTVSGGKQSAAISVDDKEKAASTNDMKPVIMEQNHTLSNTTTRRQHQVDAGQQLNEYNDSFTIDRSPSTQFTQSQSRRGRHKRVRRHRWRRNKVSTTSSVDNVAITIATIATNNVKSPTDCSYPCSVQTDRVMRCKLFDVNTLALCELAEPQAVEIDLSDTSISRLDAEAFSGGAQHVVRLRLDGAIIRHLTVNVFSNLPALRVVSIRGFRGSITDMLEAIAQSNSVKEV